MRKSRVLMITGVAGMLLILSVGMASAHFLGGRWPWSSSNSLLYLPYQNQAGAYPAYSTAVSSAASAWYYTPTPLYPYSSTAPKIVANTTFDSAGGYWGVAHIYADKETCVIFFCWTSREEIPYQSCTSPCSLGSGWSDYRSATATMNRATLDAESAFIKQKVAVHELGHTFGLGHTSCTAVMRQGSVSWNTPQTHDNYDVNVRYPSASWSSPYGC